MIEKYRWNRQNSKSLLTPRGGKLQIRLLPEIENILRKNMLTQVDFEKLSLDYQPLDPTILMTMRKVPANNWKTPISLDVKVNFKRQDHRNSCRKDKSLINREITKIKNGIHMRNLKNKIMSQDKIQKKSVIERHTYVKNTNEENMNFLDNTSLKQRIACNHDVQTKSFSVNIINEKQETSLQIYSSENVSKFEYKMKPTCLKPKKIVDNKYNHKHLLKKKNIEVIHPALNENIEINSFTVERMPSGSKQEGPDKDIPKKDTQKLFKTKVYTENNSYVSERYKYLGKKYLSKWKSYKRINDNSKKDIINRFFDELLRKKLNVAKSQKNHSAEIHGQKVDSKNKASDFANYQHRYQVQKNIIALQKSKIEQQHRVIETLKFSKIVEESKNSLDDLKNNVKDTYAEVDRRMKPKIKYLSNELHAHEIEDKNLILYSLKVPQFLQRMEKRAREREEKHAMIRERRIQMEEEKLKLKLQAELEKIQMDKDEKINKMKELRERRKREKIENIRKKKHTEKLRSLIVMADLHYERNLLNRCGIKPWKLLLKIRKENMGKAKSHYIFQTKKNVFLNWLWHTEDMIIERQYLAEEFHRKKLLRKTFMAFKIIHREMVLKRQVAEDYYDLYVTQICMRTWKCSIAEIQKYREQRWLLAIRHYESNLLFKALTHWRALPVLHSLHRELEAKKARWRKKVLQVVPDYEPPIQF